MIGRSLTNCRLAAGQVGKLVRQAKRAAKIDVTEAAVNVIKKVDVIDAKNAKKVCCIFVYITFNSKLNAGN